MSKLGDNLVHFIITGGTIDSRYDGLQDAVKPLQTSVIPQVIESLQLYTESTYSVICLKDSRDINTEDRKKMAEAINESEAKRFIITHGTYTIPDTARYLQQHVDHQNQKVIILTGAVTPIEGFTMSDGLFNLGFVYAKVFELAPGIYASLNGRVYKPDEMILGVSENRRIASLFNQ
ncbi:MAG TPA: asparaginase domain-containing protein [Candidatus Limnocylindrales bacterium]|nr:asparaginase domain-containing protein [Candidatus Limnocylindrales bacterium]